MQKYVKFISLLTLNLIFCNTLIFAKSLSEDLHDFLDQPYNSGKCSTGFWNSEDKKKSAYQQFKTVLIESFKKQTSEPLNGNTVEEVIKKAEQLDPIHLESHHFYPGQMLHNMTHEQIDAAQFEAAMLKSSLYYYPYPSVLASDLLSLCKILDPNNEEAYKAIGHCLPSTIHLYRLPYKYYKMLYPLIINIFNKYDPTLANILQRLFVAQIQWESSTKDGYIKWKIHTDIQWKIHTEQRYYEKFDPLAGEFINSAEH